MNGELIADPIGFKSSEVQRVQGISLKLFLASFHPLFSLSGGLYLVLTLVSLFLMNKAYNPLPTNQFRLKMYPVLTTFHFGIFFYYSIVTVCSYRSVHVGLLSLP